MRRFLIGLLLLSLGAVDARAQAGHEHKHPDVAIRIDQALLETEAVRDAEREAVAGKLKNVQLSIKDDGLHIKGKYPIMIIGSIDFEAVVTLVWTSPNVFEARLHQIKVFSVDLTRIVLSSVQADLSEALKGVCAFQRLGAAPDGSQVLRVSMDMKAMMPAMPALELSGITTRDKVLILKAKLP
jgi:hypothetical protein